MVPFSRLPFRVRARWYAAGLVASAAIGLALAESFAREALR